VKPAAAIVAILLFAHLSTAQTASPGTCSQTDLNHSADQVQSTRKRLLELPIGDGAQTDVSPAAKKEIASMKEALGAFIADYVQCVPLQPNVAKIQGQLSALSHTFQMPSGSIAKEDVPADLGKFGFELWFETKVFENPPLLGITAHFSIECGHDTVLFLFAPSGGLWKEVLRWRKEPYTRVDGGTMAFDYGVSPTDGDGNWFLVTHDIAPWCSSTWSGIRYSVLRPTADALHPEILFSADDFMWWGNEDYGTLTVQKDAFDLRFHSASLDTGVHNRVFIRHFSVIGDEVRRTQPVAVSPRDFVDEWIVSPWEEAAQWSSTSSLPLLRKSHAQWSRLDESENTLLEYYSMRRCSDAQDHYQVEIGEATGPKFQTSRSFYFHVLGSGAYTMLRVSDKPDGRCIGPNLLDENHEVR